MAVDGHGCACAAAYAYTGRGPFFIWVKRGHFTARVNYKSIPDDLST